MNRFGPLRRSCGANVSAITSIWKRIHPTCCWSRRCRNRCAWPVPHRSHGLDRLKQPRSTIPAVTHVDYSARIQTVTREQNPRLYALLEEFERATGCGVLVNTSFNVRGEPIICTPDDAYRCFVNTEMDYLVIGNFIMERTAQPHKELARTFEPIPD